MLAGASISRAGASKEKPRRTARPAIEAHARRPVAAQGGRQAAAAAWHIDRAGRLVRSWIRIEGRQCTWRRDRRELAPVPRQGEGGESGRRCARGGTTCQGPTVRGEGRMSAQSSWPAAGDRNAPVSGRGVASGRSDVSERRGRTNPVRGPASHRGTLTPSSGRTGGRQPVAAAWHTGWAGRLVRSWIRIEGQ
jgi:hypothetical protein